MSTNFSNLMFDTISLIEIELLYAAAELENARHGEGDLDQMSAHLVSALSLLRGLGRQSTDPLEDAARANLCLQ